MPRRLVEDERIHVPRDTSLRRGGDYVLYWMQQSQRADHNPALEHAVRAANDAGLPLVVGFGLMDGYPEANLRHYRFMLEGLKGTARALERRGIAFVLRRGHPAEVALGLAADAALVVCDRGYTGHQRTWRARVAEGAACRVEEVEGDVVVPVETASTKREYAARTLRPRIHRVLDRFLEPLATTPLERHSTSLGLESEDLSNLDALIGRLDLDRSVPPVSHVIRGGTSQAKARARRFRDEHLARYDELSNQPQTDAVSGMSPYLHFGQVSPVWLALEVGGGPADGAAGGRTGGPAGSRTGGTAGGRTGGTGGALAGRAARDAWVEQLVVRRELAVNYAWFEPEYASYGALPTWARRTLDEHRHDERGHVYTRRELEAARTHDPYWNAAQREMRYTGFMHNYMRMYWGKKIIEWTRTPEHAHATALYLNNRYFVDGRGPNAFANVGWLFGLHDRPWGERDVFGTVRYMSAGGLERKADPEAYVAKVDRLVAEAERAGVVFDDEG